ncbi:sensor histidine kinase [Comamonas testosteroni]|uniref:C4-dicarboxylate transport sensor protein DctB n=1 Tax=Comamonas testosteroni TaxID=285 RepID=A0A373FDE3_COMTE|nr:ATP-binding protein [Comamonas testosteroni]RGE41429.1 sensor histidine kinase [Comamonas testosteroni]
MPAPRSSLPRSALLTLLWLALSLCSAWAAYGLARESAMETLQADASHRLDLYVASLQREIDKFAFLPGIVALQPQVQSLLHKADDKALQAEVNHYLEELNQRAGTLSVYLINQQGLVVAASNWQRADSFLGENLSFRPYVQQALREGHGRYFGIGTTRGEPGYYLTTTLGSGGVQGVAVVKVGLAQLEHSWSAAESPVFVSDENTVLMLSNVPAWRFATLDVLDEARREELQVSQKYNRRQLSPLGWQVLEPAVQGNASAMLVQLPETGESPEYSSGQFLALSRSLGATPWRMTVLLPMAAALQLAESRALLAGVLVALGLLLALLLEQRRRHRREQTAARQALQQAHDALERKVQQRTVDLQTANVALQQEVAERMQAEQTLRAAQDELVQAGKMAVIGQLSTEVAHELNQPLAALRALAGNSQRFLERGQTDVAQRNLQRMAELADRMGALTGQLRNFARKSAGEPQRVAVSSLVDGALAVLETRLKRSVVLVDCQVSAQLQAWCDANRVQQVLVNLLANALDAMQGSSAPHIEIDCRQSATHVEIAVRDHGPGLSDDTLHRLFEPFFTTKPEGQGLGLGLSLSADIARAGGGSLQGANHPHTGAVFTLSLPLADTQPLS